MSNRNVKLDGKSTLTTQPAMTSCVNRHLETEVLHVHSS
jgi:hypothetical protein